MIRYCLFVFAGLLSAVQAFSHNTFPQNGNVGIGTNSPDELFDVKGASLFGPPTERISLGSGSLGFNRRVVTGQIFDVRHYAYQMQHMGNNNQGNDYLAFQVYHPNGTHVTPYALTINSSGNVGIGTPSPDATLAVNGTIHSKEVKVDMIGWPDYVFRPTYHLPPLNNVKSYINHNGHLPEMPSATEVEKQGVSLGEMNRLLLKKVEELTLYLIDLKKDYEDLIKRVRKLENKK